MAKRLTPIERAIAGENQDRRQRYVERLRERGLVYVRVLVPVDQVDSLREFAQGLVKHVTSDGSVTSDTVARDVSHD